MEIINIRNLELNNWGNNSNGILGIENTTIESIKIPTEIIPLRNISISCIVTGTNHTIILSGKQILFLNKN